MQAPVSAKIDLTVRSIAPIDDRLRVVGLVLAGSALLALSARVEIPMWPVPVTAQTLVLFIVAGVLGSRLGAGIVIAYLLEGSLGLPVFSGATGGLAHLLGPSGGYLVGFWLAALLVGRLAGDNVRRSPVRTLAVMLCASLAIYAAGALWLARFVDVRTVIATGVLPFLVGDLAKSILAALVVTCAHTPFLRRAS